MTLKINNDTITTTDLTGTSSKYFNTQLEQLIPNSSYSLLGSPLQRQLLKEKAESSLNYQIKYTPVIDIIHNPGNNTDLFTEKQIETYIYTGGADKYIQLSDNATFMPTANTWDVYVEYTYNGGGTERPVICLSNGNYSGVFLRTNSSGVLGLYISLTGSTWNWNASTITLSAGTKYYFHLYYTGTNYNLDYRLTEKEEWTHLLGYEQSTRISTTSLQTTLLAWKYNVSSYYSSGSVNLSTLLITYDNNVYFNGYTNSNYLNIGCSSTTEYVTVPDCKPFSLDFSVKDTGLTQGTKYLLEHPNLVTIKSENQSLFFKFPWLNSTWYTLPNNILQGGTNTVNLVSQPKVETYYAYNANSTLIYTTNTNFTTQYMLYNAAINGTLNKQGIGIYSGFSDTNNVLVTDYINSATNLSSFEIYTAININTASTGNLGIIDSSGDSGKVGIRLTTSPSNTLRFRVSTNGATDYPVDITGVTPIPINKWFYIHVMYDSNTGYLLYSSLDKENWTPEGSSSTTTRPYISTTRSVLTIGDNAASGFAGYFTGSIDMYETTFTINSGSKLGVVVPYINTYIYDDSLQVMIPTPIAYEDNGNIVLNNETYARDSSNDIVDQSIGKNIKLIVNGHNFTLVDGSTSTLPIITTGVLGALESIVF